TGHHWYESKRVICFQLCPVAVDRLVDRSSSRGKDATFLVEPVFDRYATVCDVAVTTWLPTFALQQHQHRAVVDPVTVLQSYLFVHQCLHAHLCGVSSCPESWWYLSSLSVIIYHQFELTNVFVCHPDNERSCDLNR